MVWRRPFSGLLSSVAKQYALILIESGQKLLSFMGVLNCECPFPQVRSIKSLIAARDHQLASSQGILPDFDAQSVPYQRLKVKRGLFSLCMNSEDQINARRLKELVFDFARSYLQFEKELVGNMLADLID